MSPLQPGPAQLSVQCVVAPLTLNETLLSLPVCCLLLAPLHREYILENSKSETPVVHAAAAGGGQAGTCTFRTSLDCSRHLHPIVTHYGNGSKYKWYGHVYNMMKLASHGLTLDLQAFRII